MLEPFFFALGLANNGFLIAIFLVQQEQKTWRYTVFLGIFLAFLAIEALYDWILQISFRETMNWKQLTPYIALYFAMNYGFVVMVWKYYSVVGGIVMLTLFVIQIV